MKDGTFIRQLLWPSYFLFRRQRKSVGEFAPDKSGKPEIVPTRGPEVGWEDQLIRMRLLASMKEMMVERMDESGREAMTNVQNCLVGTFLRGTPMYRTEGPREEKERDVSTLQTVLWKHCTFKLSIRDPLSLSSSPTGNKMGLERQRDCWRMCCPLSHSKSSLDFQSSFFQSYSKCHVVTASTHFPLCILFLKEQWIS